jgi:hypothetical protein
MPTAVQPSTSDYCRQARRLRGTLAHRPGRLHVKLRELAAKHDRPVERPHRQIIPSRAGAFAEEVARRLEGTVLRYSQRRLLMNAARQMGIGEFEANLVIAAVQHERRGSSPPPVTRAGSTPRPWLPSLVPLLTVIAVEALIGFGVWHVCFA